MSEKDLMKIKEGFILRQVADNYLVVAVGDAVKKFKGMITLNETGAFIWKALEKGATEDELVEKLTAEYKVDEPMARADVDKFVNKIKKANLLK